MSIENPNVNKGGRPLSKPILRSEIEEAQRHTNSNMAAARYLNVHYLRYKKYATLYGLFDSHANPKGFGVDKGWSKSPQSIPIKDILNNKYPNYNHVKLKNRLVARKKLEDRCSTCGFSERRITDGKTPLMLDFKDGNRKNFNLDNLTLTCYNCMFLTTGAPSVVNRNLIEKSLTNPEKIPRKYNIPIVTADFYDKSEDNILWDISLTEEEKRELLENLEEES